MIFGDIPQGKIYVLK